MTLTESDMFHVKLTKIPNNSKKAIFPTKKIAFFKSSKRNLLKRTGEKLERVECFKCRYFFITWDPNFPKGCKAYQFKTKQLPAIEVKKASGQTCLRFEKK